MPTGYSTAAFPWLIAVHGGAGYHSTDPASEKAVRHALRSACSAAIRLLKHEEKSLSAVELAIRSLEDDECLNAGYGANLTIDGTVECDASIMDGVTHYFGSVGAVQGVKNPISLAREVLENSRKPQPLGRVPPLTLVGPGAQSFASSSGHQLVNQGDLISENAQREWQKWKTRLESANLESEATTSKGCQSTLASAILPKVEDPSLLEDTVGAVACDTTGKLSAGVSSGGLLLKYPGRIGEAAVFGAGVWAQSPPGARTGVACSVSGTGENIIRTSFARTLSEALLSSPPEETHNILQEKLGAFCDEIGRRGEEPNVGVLLVTKEFVKDDTTSDSEFEDDDLPSASEESRKNKTPQDDHTQQNPLEKSKSDEIQPQPEPEISITEQLKLRLWCAFTTESMAIAYASSEEEKPHALIIRRRRHLNTDAKRNVHIVALALCR